MAYAFMIQLIGSPCTPSRQGKGEREDCSFENCYGGSQSITLTSPRVAAGLPPARREKGEKHCSWKYNTVDVTGQQVCVLFHSDFALFIMGFVYRVFTVS
jgi:hypothetical protein